MLQIIESGRNLVGDRKPLRFDKAALKPGLREKVVYLAIPERSYFTEGGTPLQLDSVAGLHRTHMRKAVLAAGAGPDDLVIISEV